MPAIARPLYVALVALLVISPARAQEATSESIKWSKDLPTAFAEAEAQKKILMICVNARLMKKSGIEESANKALREVVYKAAPVVAKSREFVCVLFTPSSNSGEFGELRLLGIEGDIISPQHIFVSPGGTNVLIRQEYWSHGRGDPAVKALVAMMNKAQAKHLGVDAVPKAGDPAAAPAAPKGAGRVAWIQQRITEVKSGDQKTRQARIDLLVISDKDGDCVAPLVLMLTESNENIGLTIDLIFGLGRDKLEVAALPICKYLTDKSADLRGHSAVSLEYIGSSDKKVVAALQKAAGKEKNEDIASHMYRALGRCGAKSSKARSFLLKKAGGAKSEFASYGPVIGLAYFEKDTKAARGLEKLIKKVGLPGGRRGGGQNTVKRGVFCWSLAQIQAPKSQEFVQEELIEKMEHVKAFWAAGLVSFYRQVSRACVGDAEAMTRVTQGVRGFVSYAKNMDGERYDREARSMMDIYRKGRPEQDFAPKGDYLLGGG
jgi:hypothetical protein